MYSSLAEVFKHHFKDVKFDNKLAVDLYKYHIYMSTMNAEHIQFFGGNLLGVNTLRFVPRDVRKFFDTVINVEYTALEKDIRSLDTIYHENTISGDIFNLTLFYIIHRFYTTQLLPEPRRMRAAYDTALIFCYRCTFALTNARFRYAVDPKVAQAAYANLSNKHLIKQLGTWKKLCDYRATRLVEKTSKQGKPGQNYARLYLFNDDIEVTSMIQDSQGRFKSIFRSYYDEFDKVHSDGESIAVTAATIVDADGDIVLKERTKGTESYVNYARDLINDTIGFLDKDLMTVVVDMNKNTSFRMVNSTLEWIANAYHDPKYNKLIDQFITDVVVQGMYYIEYNIPVSKKKDVPFIMTTLMNMFLSTRSKDPQLLAIRDQGEKLLRASDKGISNSLMTATRSAVILYIILRVMWGNKGR